MPAVVIRALLRTGRGGVSVATPYILLGGISLLCIWFIEFFCFQLFSNVFCLGWKKFTHAQRVTCAVSVGVIRLFFRTPVRGGDFTPRPVSVSIMSSCTLGPEGVGGAFRAQVSGLPCVGCAVSHGPRDGHSVSVDMWAQWVSSDGVL